MKLIYGNTLKRALLSTIIVLFSMASFSATYYVSNTGNDSNSGMTAALAWKTIAKVNGKTFVAGDQVLFQKGSTWAETLSITSSGLADKPIVFGTYGTGINPVITGSDTRAQTVMTNNKSYITIDGFTLRNAAGTHLGGSVNVGNSTVQGVVIKNCTIENNRRCGIVLKGSSLAASVTIDNCVIQNNGQMGILVFNEYVSGQISNNQLLGNGWAADQDAQQMSNIQGNLGNLNIYGNTIYNAAPGTVKYNTMSHGIYVSSPTIVAANIYNNKIYGNLSGAGIKVRFTANIYNNTIYGNRLQGIMTGGNGSSNAVYNIHHNVIYGSTTGFPCISEEVKEAGNISLIINNNTLYKSGSAYSSTKEISITDKLTALTVKNNLFYSANGRGGIGLAAQSNATIDYNLYWKDAESGVPNNIYNGTTYSTLASWRALGFDTHGLNVNPKLISPSANFQLQSTSPAINAGVNVGSTTDCKGSLIVGLPDIGAYECVISSPLTTSFTFTGPTSGNVNSASTNFTVTPNNLYTGTITINPMGTGSAGLSAKVLTFSNSSTAQSFTITPSVAGSITLTATNSGSLNNPTNLIYTVNAVNSGNANLGYNVKGSSVYSSAAGAMNSSQFTAFSSFTATTMYVSMAAVNCKIKGAIYTDNAGRPGNKLGETLTVTPSADGFQKLTGLNVSIVSGTKYWLVVWGSSSIKIDCETSGGLFAWKGTTTYKNWWEAWYQKNGDLPSSFPTIDGSSVIKCSIYVESGLKSAIIEESARVMPIVDIPEEVKIDVFPNPSVGKITVRFSLLPEADSRIEIYDISGRKVDSRFITESAEEFNLDNQTDGLYLVKSILGSRETVQKLILKK